MFVMRYLASQVGVEPTAYGLEVRCAIHCATETSAITTGLSPNGSPWQPNSGKGTLLPPFHPDEDGGGEDEEPDEDSVGDG